MRPVRPVSPGEMLDDEFLEPLGLTKYRLAKDIGVPPHRIGDIVAGNRAIAADTGLRLCRYFGLSDGWWLRGQANYDTAIAREAMGETLASISRCPLLAACAADPERVDCLSTVGLFAGRRNIATLAPFGQYGKRCVQAISDPLEFSRQYVKDENETRRQQETPSAPPR